MKSIMISMALSLPRAQTAAVAEQVVTMDEVAGIDFTSPMAELPRTAGSPLLVVVVSLIILGALAFMEFASLSES